jgi:hypothetical protein
MPVRDPITVDARIPDRSHPAAVLGNFPRPLDFHLIRGRFKQHLQGAVHPGFCR